MDELQVEINKVFADFLDNEGEYIEGPFSFQFVYLTKCLQSKVNEVIEKQEKLSLNNREVGSGDNFVDADFTENSNYGPTTKIASEKVSQLQLKRKQSQITNAKNGTESLIELSEELDAMARKVDEIEGKLKKMCNENKLPYLLGRNHRQFQD